MQIDTKLEINSNLSLILNNFHVGECVNFMQNNIADNSVDLIITSPPYDNLRNYNGYTFNFKEIAFELYRITKKRRSCSLGCRR